MEPIETIPTFGLEIACEGEGGVLGHPRVYLHIERETGDVICPYCSRHYIYRGNASAAAH